MNDPYKVLGVSHRASDEEIKGAYRELARKYHPDAYAGNPLSDLAAEKMKEINDAYDQVTSQRRAAGQDTRGGAYSAQSSSQFWDIRRLINAGRITEAEELLDGVQLSARDAEWYFLKGSIQYARGWMEEAYESFVRACELDPHNREYRAAFDQLNWQRGNGRPQNAYHTRNHGMGGCGICDICTAFICADVCCQCTSCGCG